VISHEVVLGGSRTVSADRRISVEMAEPDARTVAVLGRPTLALAVTDDWRRQEILVDPDTYAYAGQRSTVVEDAVVSPEKAGNATGEIEKGSTVIAVRVASGVVDEPGERP
jgi:hypothetical protein